MAYDNGSDRLPLAIKILVAGGFGVGKTTFIGSASEIEPLSTEEIITTASIGTDSLAGIENKTTTTVAFDFGRITLDPRHVLYLFGTPGQDRFWFLWDELSAGALGAVVLVDTRRLTACFEAIDFFENREIPFIVAINQFDGAQRYETAEVHAALQLRPHVNVVRCDARDTRSSTIVLVSLVEHLLAASLYPNPA
jgi:signal recognition particle receptor subunit beta